MLIFILTKLPLSVSIAVDCQNLSDSYKQLALLLNSILSLNSAPGCLIVVWNNFSYNTNFVTSDDFEQKCLQWLENTKIFFVSVKSYYLIF